MTFFEKNIIDKHSKILVEQIKKSLDYNIIVSKKHIMYKQLKNGAKLLWKNYFCYANENDDSIKILELLSSILQRLLNDFPTIHPDIKLYGKIYGIPLIKIKYF
jgi:hypothetical protein